MALLAQLAAAAAPDRWLYDSMDPLLLRCTVMTVCLSACLQETELRTLRAAAEEVASRFDASVSALAAKRLEVLAEVSSWSVWQGVGGHAAEITCRHNQAVDAGCV